jgi:hypothetical protein
MATWLLLLSNELVTNALNFWNYLISGAETNRIAYY